MVDFSRRPDLIAMDNFVSKYVPGHVAAVLAECPEELRPLFDDLSPWEDIIARIPRILGDDRNAMLKSRILMKVDMKLKLIGKTRINGAGEDQFTSVRRVVMSIANPPSTIVNFVFIRDLLFNGAWSEYLEGLQELSKLPPFR
jgi:hypothetical protein